MKRITFALLLFCACLMPPNKNCVSEAEAEAIITYKVGSRWIVNRVDLICEQITDADGNIVWRCVGKDTLSVKD